MTESGGRLRDRRVALGVTGSIAAYKAVELLRMLQNEGADVRVLMTTSAVEFIGTLTLETLSRHPVDSDVLALQADGRIGHIAAAHDVEAIVVAPATAHWLGAMASGLAGDTITAACLATSVPVVVAPAMDGGMYSHPATQANVARLREFGYLIVEPESGVLASGMVGRGRLADLGRIVDATVEALARQPAVGPRPVGAGRPAVAPAAEPASGATESSPSPSRSDLAGYHVVVTAGGTAEPIDPVRFVGNRSTGKMGIAVAEDALDRGAAVTLILGNVSVVPPARAHVARAETAAEMQAALRALTPPEGPRFDVLVMAAAVADFRPDLPIRQEDRPLGRADRRDGPHAGSAGRDRRARQNRNPGIGRPPASARRLRGRDRLVRAGSRETPRQGRGPAGGQRRRGARLRLRHGHQQGHHLLRRRAARGAAAAVQARGGRAASRSCRRPSGRRGEQSSSRPGGASANAAPGAQTATSDAPEPEEVVK